MSEYMNRAIELAEIAYSLGEVPVGAVVVRKLTVKLSERAII